MQSGSPAASGGLVGLLVDAEPAELVLLPVKLLVLPLLVLGVSFRTCLVTASQHFPALVVVVVALGEVVGVVDVWATASPMLFRPTWRLRSLQFRSYACGISFLVVDYPGEPIAMT